MKYLRNKRIMSALQQDTSQIIKESYVMGSMSEEGFGKNKSLHVQSVP